MFFTKLVTLILGISLTGSFTLAAGYDIVRMSDGPFSFTISGIVVNEGSSLTRESILFNDPTCPIQLTKHSHSIKYKDRSFRFVGNTEFQVAKNAKAIQIRTILYDVFGQHMQNLTNSEPRDFATGLTTVSGEWLASENDIGELLTTVTYVARVRLADGTQWVFNTDNLQLALPTLNLENKIGDDEQE